MAGKKRTKASTEKRCCCKKHAVCTRLTKEKTVRAKVAKKKVARKKVSKKKTSEERMKKSAAKKAGPIILEEKLGIQNVASLVNRLDALLKSDSEFVIDANAVESADMAALQVLVAFANSARAQSREINWKCDDGSLRQLARLSDLEQYLQFDATPAEAEDDGLCPVF